MNFDHLSRVLDKISGVIVDVKPLNNGQSLIIKPDDAKFTDRRFIGHSAELQPPDADIRPGTRVQVLPGAPTRQGRMPRAYSIEIVRDDQTRPSRTERDN
jgi:hypothetical protein